MESEWKSYNGEYEKEWYDIELESGDIIEQCWPNAGWFHSEHSVMIRENRVKRFRLCDHPMSKEML